MKKLLLTILICIIPIISFGATRYVDNTLVANTTSYSVANRDTSGSELGYKSIKDALTPLVVGDIIDIRGGTYQEGCIILDYTINGTAWTEGNFIWIRSHEGEWAIIDGENGGGTGGIDGLKVGDTGVAYTGQTIDSESKSACVLGRGISDSTGTFRYAYYKFERLEIKNGRTASGSYASGINVNVGPIWVTGCYIHDNYSTLTSPGTNNPAGVRGLTWQNCLFEYNHFFNNGLDSSDTVISHNCAHIQGFSDYQPDGWAEFGADYVQNTIGAIQKQQNTIRYNLFVGSSTAVKDKQEQYLTGRNAAGGFPLQDDLKDYGDKVHHNIIQDSKGDAIISRQDFAQVYNNIIDNCGAGIQNSQDRTIYKATFYNNTVMEPVDITGVPFSIMRVQKKYASYAFQPPEYYGYDYNNIHEKGKSFYALEEFTIQEVNWLGETIDYTGYFNDRNYSHDPTARAGTDPTALRVAYIGVPTGDPDNYRYTVSELETFLSHVTNMEFYRQAYNAGDELFEGTTGADKYITRAAHEVESGKTVGTSGVAINHPYLAGVTIPSYIGATNPNDNDWVAGVLSLDDIEVLKTIDGDPSWIEGAVPSTNPDLNCQSDAASSSTSYSSTGTTYTLEDARTVDTCTWAGGASGSGSCTATAGNITASLTGLSENANVITYTLTDSAAEVGTCNFTVTVTLPIGASTTTIDPTKTPVTIDPTLTATTIGG